MTRREPGQNADGSALGLRSWAAVLSCSAGSLIMVWFNWIAFLPTPTIDTCRGGTEAKRLGTSWGRHGSKMIVKGALQRHLEDILYSCYFLLWSSKNSAYKHLNVGYLIISTVIQPGTQQVLLPLSFFNVLTIEISYVCLHIYMYICVCIYTFMINDISYYV
jgi:hypothetical protein